MLLLLFKLNELNCLETTCLLFVCACLSIIITLSYPHLAREDPDMSFLVQIVILIMYKVSLCKFV